MKKSILVVLGVLVLVIGFGVYYVLTNLDSLVKAAIEKYGSEAVHTAVRVGSVNINLGDGAATIRNLTVANPDGFSFPHAFTLGEITVDIDIENTDEQLIAIDAIKVASPQVFYEINEERSGNLNVLQEGLNVKSTPDKKPDTKASGQGGVELKIDSFNLNGAEMKAKIVPLKNKEYDLKLPPVKLSRLEGTPEEIASQVLDQLISHAKQEIKKKGLNKELAAAKARLKAKVDQKVDEAKSRLKDKTESKVEEQKDKAKEKLKELW